MNERIEHITKQVDEYFDDLTIEFSREAWMEKFAELIVLECMEQASIGNGHGNNQWDKALTFAADNIKKHFGVKE